MRRSALMGIAAVAFVASNAFAQATSFAGTWNMVQDPAAQQGAAGGRGGRGGGGGFGPTFTVAQDAKTLTITRTTQNGDVKTVYNLDGSDSKNSVNMGGNAMDQISNAKWDGANLVVTTKITMGEQSFESKRTFSMDKDGSLWIESSSTQPGRDGNPRPATKVQNKKG
jgi:hypothetical protein